MLLGGSEMVICDYPPFQARLSMDPKQGPCCGRDAPAGIPVLMAGYEKGSSTMEIVMSAMRSSAYEQIYYLCGYQHKIKTNDRKHAFHKYMMLDIQVTDGPIPWTYTKIVDHTYTKIVNHASH